MERTDAVSRLHPGVILLFFVCTIGGTLLLSHPLFRLLSLFGALCCHLLFCRKERGVFLLKTALPVCLLAAVLNPLFNHQGVHILFYFPWGNPCTGESLLYGVLAALLLFTVLVWFRCYTDVMTVARSLFLFSRIAPSLSLLLRLSLRMIPSMRADFARTMEAQTCLFGPPPTKKDALNRAFSAIRVQLHRALENAVQLSNAMKSRGYGLPGRTSYALFRWHRRDSLCLLFLLGCALPVLGASLAGGLSFFVYPSPHGAAVTPLMLLCATVYFALCISPVFWQRLEVLAWKRSSSNM